VELGSSEWLDAVRGAINESRDFADHGAAWDEPLGVAFVGDDDVLTRHVVLDLHEGSCESARLVDEAEFAEIEFSLSAPYARWTRVLSHDLDLMRCIVLNRVQLRGDRITALRFLPAAKALLDACSAVDARVPTT